MRRSASTALGLAAAWFAVPVALAQAPRITPAGDPTVRDDTIYALVVNPADDPDDDFVYLLDDAVLRYEADGRGTRTTRQVVQILTRQGAEFWGELTFRYSGWSERLTLNWARVLRPGGEVISARPVHQQESVAPVVQNAPVYSDARMRQISLGGVEPGTLVDVSVTVERLRTAMPGDFRYSWLLTMPHPVRRSRFIADLPVSVTPRIKEANLGFAKRTSTAGGRRTHVWATAEVPAVAPEPFAADSNSVIQYVVLGAPIAWSDVARWYAALSADRYVVSPEVEAAFAATVAGATTLDDSLRALHRWVAQDFRYVSLSLGVGGYQPRLPAAVLETKYGDCKDKATLFIALARRMGVRAHPVLVRRGGWFERELPSAEVFDHMIAAIERSEGRLYLDLTADLVPYGSLPADEHGQFALLVHPDGRAEEVVLPQDSMGASRISQVLEGELTPDGLMRARYTMHAAGTAQLVLRQLFAVPLKTEDRAGLARKIANEMYPGAVVDSFQAFDGRDLRAEPRVTVTFHGGRATSRAVGGEVLTVPFDELPAGGYLPLLDTDQPRRFTIDAGDVLGPHEGVFEMRIMLPEGWRARLPANVSTTSAFGTFTAEYAQQGRVLRLTRRLRGARGTYPPERITELIAWLREASQADVHSIALERRR